MITFKHVELAKQYGVSERAVRGWIGKAKAGKLKLTLHRESGIDRIVSTASNIAVIERLVDEHRKFRNTKGRKVVSPRPEFYQLYNQAQMYDILNNLEFYHEIPRQYNYFNGGADNWDRYTQRLMAEEGPNYPKMTIGLIDGSLGHIDKLLAKYKHVNVIDVGVGNAVPARPLLKHLLDQGKLARYIALDISSEMIEIARRNVESWFGGRVNFVGHEADMTYERFGRLLAEDALTAHVDDTVNLVLLLGGTPDNFRDVDGPFQTIRDSIRPRDIVVYTDKLDTDVSRRFFDFNPDPDAPVELAPNHRFIFDLLNIDKSFYDVKTGFDLQKFQRFIRVRLNVALAIRFDFGAGERIVEFNKGTTILLLRVWANSAHDVFDIFERNHFNTLHSNQSEDGQYMLAVARVKV